MFAENTEELAQNKLLLLYIIKMLPYSFTDSELTEFILEKNYMNYFSLKQYLLELIESEFIGINNLSDKKDYIILKKGEMTLNYFQNKIPQKIKDELSNDFKLQEIKKKEANVIADYFEKGDNQYTVNLKLVEKEETLFSLYINVVSISQAKMICQSWKENTEAIYKNIINMLIE